MSSNLRPLKTSFQQALSGAVALLQGLPRQRSSVETALTRFSLFKDSHHGLRCDLLIDQPPGSSEADYDVFLGTPDGGTVAVSWRPDKGVPWTVEYSDHWAANYVLTVNGCHTSIQSALIYLNTTLTRKPALMEDLINRLLIQEAIEASPPAASEREIQRAVDDFRSSQGLYSAADTRQWLEKMSLTMEALRELMVYNVRCRKLKTHVTAGKIRPYFQTHRQDFDLVKLFRVWAPTKAIADAVGKAGRRSDLWKAIHTKGSPLPALKGELATAFAGELPPPFTGVPPNTIIGPERSSQGYWVGEIQKRKPARLDSRTRNSIEDLLFQEWLAERRKQATIRWHWL